MPQIKALLLLHSRSGQVRNTAVQPRSLRWDNVHALANRPVREVLYQLKDVLWSSGCSAYESDWDS